MNAPSKAEPTSAKPLTHRETMWIVAGVLLPVFMGSMDQTVVSSALPTIGRSLGSTSNLSWVVAANLLTATAMTPLYGKISDIHGRRKSLLLAICLFLLGALIAGFSVNLPMLIVGRAVQGLGTGGLVSVPMTVLGDLVAPKQRARYYTYFSIIYITSGALGPVYGGFISQHAHWSLIFFTNLPMGLLSLAIVGILLKRLPRYERPHKLDVLGAVLIVLASSTCMFVLNSGGQAYAWTSPEVIGLSLLSLGFWIAFVRRLLTAPEPLIPLTILRNKIVLRANIANAIGWASVIGLNIYLPMYLQAVHGLSPSASGVQLVGLMTAVNFSALVGAQIAARITHYKYPPLASLLVTIAACLYLALHTRSIGMAEFEVVLVLIGLGFGAVAPVSTVAMQNAVELHQMGISVGTVTFLRSLVATGMVAIYGVIVLGDMRGAGLRGAAMPDIYGDPQQAADHFRVVFLCTTATFGVSFLALLAMEEKPLLSERQR